jgi:hypothetical protein
MEHYLISYSQRKGDYMSKEEPLLELTKINKQINKLKLIKARAASRVKQRIVQQKEEARLRELEKELMVEELDKPKKGEK